MRTSKPLILFVPTEIVVILKKHIKNKIENYYYIIDYMISKGIQNKKKESEFFSLNYKTIKQVISCEPDKYIKKLKKYEIIKDDGIYTKGEKKYHYQINPNIKFDNNFIEILPDTNIYKRINKKLTNSKANYNKLAPHLYEMCNKFRTFNYDYEEAFKWIKNKVDDNYKKAIYFYSVKHLEDKRYRYFKRNQTNNRLDTNLTNLKKELRQFIKGEFISIDLNNSQPFFLLLLITIIINQTKELNNKQNKQQETIPLCWNFHSFDIIETFGIKAIKEISKIHIKSKKSFFMNLSLYSNWVTKGLLYDNFISHYDKKISRDDVKKIMYKVLFSRNSYIDKHKQFIPFQKEKNIFSSVFPVIYDIVFSLKRKNNSNLAITLQKMESEIFIDEIAKKLVDNGIAPFTVHDSVIVEKKHSDKVLIIMQNVFKEKFGVVPAFHVEAL